MSWIKGAFDRVRERSSTVKGIAKDVVQITKEVKSRLTGSSTAADMQAIIETRAGSVSSDSQFNDVVRTWISNIQSDEQHRGYRYTDTATDEARQLTFTQVLLRSNAIEELLAAVVLEPGVRMELGGAWITVKDDSPDASPTSDRTHATSDYSEAQLAASLLFQLLSRTLSGGDKVWFELVATFLSPHGHDSRAEVDEEPLIESRVSRCERSGFRSLELGMLTQLKKDWLDNWLEEERREMAIILDQKRRELIERISTLTNLTDPTNTALWLRIRLSAELVDLYEAVKDNLDVCNMRRAELRKDAVSVSIRKKQEAEKFLEKAVNEIINANERQKTLNRDSVQSDHDFKPQLEAVMEERSAIDSRITKLEIEKARLRIELERVSGELADAQSVQRVIMDAEFHLRNQIGDTRNRFASLMAHELKEENAEQMDVEIYGKEVKILEQIHVSIDAEFATASAELGEIYAQFDNAFIEAVQDHLLVLSDMMDEMHRAVKRLCEELDMIYRTRSSQALSRKIVGVELEEKEELDAMTERLNVKCFDVENKLRSETGSEVDRFSATFKTFHKRFESKFSSNRLLNGQVEKISETLALTQALIHKYTLKRSN